jgi:hypothetical protein
VKFVLEAAVVVVSTVDVSPSASAAGEVRIPMTMTMNQTLPAIMRQSDFEFRSETRTCFEQQNDPSPQPKHRANQ